MPITHVAYKDSGTMFAAENTRPEKQLISRFRRSVNNGKSWHKTSALNYWHITWCGSN